MKTRTPRSPLIAPGNVVQLYSETEASELTKDWLAVFGKSWPEAEGEPYLWHIFSAERYPSVSGSAAIDLYREQVGAGFVVLSNDRRTAFLTDQLPESSSPSDYYVFPSNLAWTMAFTHEDGWLGPYFARHTDFAALSAANQAKVRKRQEAEEARRKGWS